MASLQWATWTPCPASSPGWTQSVRTGALPQSDPPVAWATVASSCPGKIVLWELLVGCCHLRACPLPRCSLESVFWPFSASFSPTVPEDLPFVFPASSHG